ncbi:hypothetical protein KSP39_PZI009673 [Platanthera zijinensis]|uniref:Uncharacterized protein n=1 Tax=Platanthera zijinensis TaxID=2320716 RepID=A0AAP0BLH0_9ASPA
MKGDPIKCQKIFASHVPRSIEHLRKNYGNVSHTCSKERATGRWKARRPVPPLSPIEEVEWIPMTWAKGLAHSDPGLTGSRGEFVLSHEVAGLLRSYGGVDDNPSRQYGGISRLAWRVSSHYFILPAGETWVGGSLCCGKSIQQKGRLQLKVRRDREKSIPVVLGEPAGGVASVSRGRSSRG